MAGPKTEVALLKISILMREKGRKFMRANVKQSVILVAFLLLMGVEIAGVRQASAQQAPPPPPSKFKLMSSGYAEGSMIPTEFSCADPNAASPAGIVQGKNIRNVNGYQPPCPPPGATPHHYIFEIYALDTKLDLMPGSARADLLKAMDGHVVGKATYFGLYGR